MPHRQETDERFGVAVKALMAEREMSLRALARSVELSPGYLSKLTRGIEGRHPPDATVKRIAEALGVRPTYFREYRESLVWELMRVRRDDVTTPALEALREGIANRLSSQHEDALRQRAASERRVTAAARILYKAWPAGADVPWSKAEAERRDWMMAVARRMLRAADTVHDGEPPSED